MNSDKVGKDILENLGFSVEKIPESDKKSSDYITTYQNQKFIFEVKLKEDNERQFDEKHKILDSGKVYSISTTIGRNETLSGIVRDSAKQLKSTSSNMDGFRIVVLVCTGVLKQAKLESFFHTLYGSIQIFDTNTRKLKDCFFYNHSDFFRRKSDVDGALIVFLNDDRFAISFCLNNFSSNYNELKISSFLKSLDEKEIVDPIERERNGAAFINDSNEVAKKGEIYSFQTPILNYISNKYSLGPLPLHPMYWNVAEVSFLVPDA